MPDVISCPHCTRRLHVPGHLQGSVVQCPGCQSRFTVPVAGDPPTALPIELATPLPLEPAPAAEPHVPSRPELPIELGEPVLDFPPPYLHLIPSRREEITSQLGPPARLLLAVALSGILLGFVLFMMSAFNASEGPETLGLKMLGSLMAIAASLLVAAGAYRMLQLRSYPLVVFSAVLAVSPCFFPCCFLGLPIGIWALAVLNRPDVRAAFET